MNGVRKHAQNLIDRIFTAADLKKVSVALESLSQSKTFKAQVKDIANDDHLPRMLKKKEILALLKAVEMPVLSEFFGELLDKEENWIFGTDKFDYFDDFVQAFQMLTEEIMVIHLVTAIEVKTEDVITMTQNLSEAFGKKVIIHLQVNPQILGGTQARLGNLVFDYSIRSKFSQFQRQWLSKLNKTSQLVGQAD